MPRSRSYAALGRYLAQFRDPELAVTFPTIEAVLGRPLPDAAWQTAAWWTEADLRAPQRAAWRRAGWEVVQVNMQVKVVTFQRLPAAPPSPQSTRRSRPAIPDAAAVAEPGSSVAGAMSLHRRHPLLC